MFDDLFSSVRSPGFVGIVLGLVVIGGFGTLGALVFDGRVNGEVATKLEQRIESLQHQISSANQKLKQLNDQTKAGEKRTEIAERVEAAKRDLSTKQAKIEELQLAMQDGQLACEKYEKDLNRYRDQVRRVAEGEKLETLQTLDGRAYKTVTIKKVSDAGIEFSHETGTGRVLFPNLPLEWQKRFRYNPDEHSDALLAEKNQKSQHDEMVNKALAEQQKRNEISAWKAGDDTRKYKAGVLAKDIASLEARLEGLRRDYDRDSSRAASAGSGKIVATKTGQLSRDIKSTEEQLVQKRSELTRVLAE